MGTHTVYFIRHGQTDWNAEIRLQGQRDIPLNAKGRAQAARNGGVLAELIAAPDQFDFISSPLSRTAETMAIMRETMGLPRDGFRTDDRIKEIAFGDWEGRTWIELRSEAADLVAQRAEDTFHFRPPGNAENYADLTARVTAWFGEIERDTVVVAHGGVSRALRGHLLELPRAEITELKVPQDKVMRIEGRVLTWL